MDQDKISRALDRLKQDIQDTVFNNQQLGVTRQSRVVFSGGRVYRQLEMDVVHTEHGPAFVAGAPGK